MWITTNSGKFFKKREYQTTSPASWETYMQVKKQQLELEMEQQTFQIGKGVCQSCILSPCLFNLYTEYIMWNAWLDKVQDGIKIAGRNIHNLRYADDTILEKELKSLLMNVTEESEKVSQKTKIMASSAITSWQIDGENNGNSDRLYFLGLQNHCRWWEKLWPT